MCIVYFGIRGRSINMTLLYLCTLCFCIAGIHMGVVESNMCDDGWVYNSITATCLKTTSDVYDYNFVSKLINPCLNRTGGEFRNISGRVVEFTETIEPFLRDYLQFMKLPAAGVELSSWLKNSLFRYISPSESFKGNIRTYFVPGLPVLFQSYVYDDAPIICQVTAGPIEPPVCPRDVKLVSTSYRNATLSWSPGQLGRKVVVQITVQICDGGPLSCTHFRRISFRDGSLFQQMNYTVSELEPNKKYKLVIQIQSDKYKTKDCNVALALSTNEEPPICPRDVKLVSVSDTSAMLSLSPGQLGHRVIVNIEVQICVALSCEYFTTRIFAEKSLFRLMNYNVSGLQPNTKYKLVLQMLNDKFETKDCNVTLALQTNESTIALQTNEGQESAAAVIGLSVILSISLCVCSVLAILQCRHYRQAKKDKNSDIDKIVARVIKQTTSNQKVKLQVHKDPTTNSAMYVNAQAAPHEYEQTIENQDNHIYET